MDVELREKSPPAGWGVEIDLDAVRRLAGRLARTGLPRSDFDYAGVPDFDGERWARFVILGVSVVWRLWPPDGERMWAARDGDDWYEDAPGIWTCFRRDPASIDLERIADGDLDESFFDGRGMLQDVPTRVDRLRAVASTLIDRFDGSALALVAEAGGDATAVSDLLTTTVPGYFDRPESPEGRLPFDKLAHLATAMLSARIDIDGVDRFPVYPDYMLPMHLRHLGVLTYRADLARRVDDGIPIPAGSLEEMGIRWATIRAAELVRRAIVEQGVAVRTPDLDYWLWSEAVLGDEAGSMGRHHLTVTEAY